MGLVLTTFAAVNMHKLEILEVIPKIDKFIFIACQLEPVSYWPDHESGGCHSDLVFGSSLRQELIVHHHKIFILVLKVAEEGGAARAHIQRQAVWLLL